MNQSAPSVAEWDPDSDGPQPSHWEPPTPEYALKFLLSSLRNGYQLGRNQRTLATVEYVARRALGQADPCPRYTR